jgi:pyruvate/2-oxoglutarate dehydrogenase complex dihydrolipoamide dehydrogenase (E3) component
VAAGRRARLDGLGLEALGIPTGGPDGAGALGADAGLRTLLPNILVAGDVTGAPQFTHRAGHQGAVAALNGLLVGLWRVRADRVHIPAVTYTDPEVARIGLSRAEAAARGIAFEATRHDFAHNDRAIAEGDRRGFVQVLTPPGGDRILGVTIVGAHAGELAASFAIAMQGGIGLRRILATVLPYPTRAEAAKRVAGAWRQQRTGARSLVLLEGFNRWRRGGEDA